MLWKIILQIPPDVEKKLIPDGLDLQPLFYPLNYTQESKVEVWDEETNSVTVVYCYLKE